MYRDFRADAFTSESFASTFAPTTRVDRIFGEIAPRIDAFAALMEAADRDAERHGGVVAAPIVERIHGACHTLVRFLAEETGADSGMSDEEREDFEQRIRARMRPMIARSELSERIFTKPRGYAGDFLTIAMMYEDVAHGAGHAGRIFDRAIRDQPACAAVINRRGVLAEEIARTRAANRGGATRVTSLACGPAAELFDVFEAQEDPGNLTATCIDIDEQALAYVRERCAERNLGDRFVLHQGNLVHLATGRRKLDIPPQHLVYSIGLIDYFNDRFVICLLDYVHDLLEPGGRAIFGNFHVDNPSRALMEHVLDWKLIHRSEADMHRLFRASAFGRNCTNIRFEGQGVNMFAECVKGNG